MGNDLVDKWMDVALDHFGGGVSDVRDMQVDLLIALASLAAAVIGDDRSPNTIKHRRAVFDDMVTKGLERLVNDGLDKIHR
jgi:hypothetical protein